MKDDKEILYDLKELQTGLLSLYETRNTCNELHEYVSSKIIHYIYMNDLDKDRWDKLIPQLETAICSIYINAKYGVNTSKSQRTFRTAKKDANEILGNFISGIENKIQSANSGK